MLIIHLCYWHTSNWDLMIYSLWWNSFYWHLKRVNVQLFIFLSIVNAQWLVLLYRWTNFLALKRHISSFSHGTSVISGLVLSSAVSHGHIPLGPKSFVTPSKEHHVLFWASNMSVWTVPSIPTLRCFVFWGLLTSEKSLQASLEFHRGAVRFRCIQRSHGRHGRGIPHRGLCLHKAFQRG